MEVKLFEEDLKLEHKDCATRAVSFEKFNDDARAAIMLAGRATFHGAHESYEAVYPPKYTKDQQLDVTPHTKREINRNLAKQQGMHAYLAGKNSDDNPYPVSMTAYSRYQQWKGGFQGSMGRGPKEALTRAHDGVELLNESYHHYKGWVMLTKLEEKDVVFTED